MNEWIVVVKSDYTLEDSDKRRTAASKADVADFVKGR